MARYYKSRPPPALQQTTAENHGEASWAHVLSNFDKLQETLLMDDAEEGWAFELWRYLSTMQQDATKETGLVEWWQVWDFRTFNIVCY